jgi:hypothetical protein
MLAWPEALVFGAIRHCAVTILHSARLLTHLGPLLSLAAKIQRVLGVAPHKSGGPWRKTLLRPDCAVLFVSYSRFFGTQMRPNKIQNASRGEKRQVSGDTARLGSRLPQRLN